MEVCCCLPTAPGVAVPLTQPFLYFFRTDSVLEAECQWDKARFKKGRGGKGGIRGLNGNGNKYNKD